jgi:hypothetical protein
VPIRYRACRAARLSIAVRRGGRVIARRARRVRAAAGTVTLRGLPAGRVRATVRLGSARAVVGWVRVARRR